MLKTPQTTRLIHDNFWIVLSFAFGQPAVGKLLDEKFKGEWKYLRTTIYDHAETRADRALLEMATQLRVLDDAEDINNYFKQVGRAPFGTVTQGDGSNTDLHFRDLTNKLMHGQRYEWKLRTDDPTIIVHAKDTDRWRTAEIRIVALMSLVGDLGY